MPIDVKQLCYSALPAFSVGYSVSGIRCVQAILHGAYALSGPWRPLIGEGTLAEIQKLLEPDYNDLLRELYKEQEGQKK